MKTKFLPVGNGHTLHTERVGNINGPTIVFIHGGPGSGYSEKDKDFFDFENHNVIFFDQRSSGKSTYEGDILEKVYLFGGSWGSTLSLVFAIRYPEKIKGMILRGIYIPGNPEEDFLFDTSQEYMHPEAYKRLLKNIPTKFHTNICKFFHTQLNISNTVNKEEKQKYAYEFSLYECSLASLHADISKLEKELLHDTTVLNNARIEACFIQNTCFLPENYIFDNIDKISHIPTQIIHGRYDSVCPAKDAFTLDSKMENSSLIFPIAGHSSHDKEMKKALTDSVKNFIR